ncbi:MAG: DNA repair exonuclease [Thaumarchaeota archaeon]|nr:DNA repair exonuclease [Nitrososphaerota archaeon]
MHKFAHLSDCHLGAWKHPALQKVEIEAFYRILDTCLKEKVNFIVISGDFFHSNLPDLGVVRMVVRKLKQVHDAGVPIYVVYGSHDYSPNDNSMIDILTDAGLLTKIKKGYEKDGKIKLDFILDQQTGAKITGLSGRKMGIERHYYEDLDRELLEKESGFKIFVFHAGLDELKPKALADMDSMPISLLPRGFDYYAGGHVHKQMMEEFSGYGKVCYPGPSFAGYSRDLEDSARGQKRGFFIVEFDEKVRDVKFREIDSVQYLYFEHDATDKNANIVQEELKLKIGTLDAKGKIVVMKIKGDLSGGKTSDINFSELRQLLNSKGAIHVQTNRYDLRSKEYLASISGDIGQDPKQIEERILRENIDSVKVSFPALKGKEGSGLAIELLAILRQDQKANERKSDYVGRVLDSCKESLHLEEIE